VNTTETVDQSFIPSFDRIKDRPPTPFWDSEEKNRSRSPSPEALSRPWRRRRTSSSHSAGSSASSPGASTPNLIAFDKDSPPTGFSWFSQIEKTEIAQKTSLTSQREQYVYKSLKEDHIRLLLLHKGSAEDAIKISTDSYSLRYLEEGHLEYYALSYSWGSQDATESISLMDLRGTSKRHKSQHQTAFKPFHVRPNLHVALKHMRSEVEDLWMWVDALSINQNDDHEKSNQIPKMLQIYSNACGVCIWLGEADVPNPNLGKAHGPLDFVHFLVNLKLLDRWIQSEEPDEAIVASLVAFAKLLRKSWFQRRWVIQEVSAAQEASVHYGGSKVHWIDFADAVQLFLAHIDRIRTIYRKSRLCADYPDAFSHVESTGAVTLVTACTSLIKRTADGDALTRLWTIESLVTTFTHFEASDPRDIVYAMLALALDGPTNSEYPSITEDYFAHLSADYSQCAHKVYVDFVKHVVNFTGSLDIICRHWAPVKNSCTIDNSYDCRGKQPSWISSVAKSPFGPPSEMTGRLNGDSLVGIAGRPQYKASRGIPPKANFTMQLFDAMISRPMLQTTGLVLGTVRKRSSRVVNGIIPQDCFHIAGWNRGMEVDSIPDCLWRTLIADRTADGKKAPSWWRRACMHCLTETDYNGDLDTSKIIERASLPRIVIDGYLKQVQSVVWNRRLFIIESHDSNDTDEVTMLGLGPSDVMRGDIVCILFGCSVPVILRELDRSRSLHQLVGECFVHERMDGEAVAVAELNEFENLRQFNIT
jgi:hypothetical protein